MPPLQGLTGLTNPSQSTDMGVLSAHAAPGTGTEHGQIGDQAGQAWPAAYGVGYNAQSYPSEIQLGGNPGEQPGSGAPGIDLTPSVHSAPWPAGYAIDGSTQESIDTAAQNRDQQRRTLHCQDLGGPRAYSGDAPGGRETIIHTTVDRYEAPNVTTLSSELSGQLKSAGTGGGASKDTTQGLGQLNSTDEFARGHSIRIVQHDKMPWDRSLDYAPPQPFWGRYPIGDQPLDGPDSPYFQAGDTSTGQQVVWEGRIGYPTAYSAPPEPVTIPIPTDDGTQDVWAYDY